MRAALALAAALVAGSCGPAATATPGVSPTSRTPARELAGQQMRECTVGATLARCGSLLVPVDPARPDGRRIDLRVAVVPATGSDRVTKALFLITGGPGGASTESFSWATTAFAGLRPTHDFVMVDQRGTGGSDQLRIPPRPDVGGLSPAARADALAAWTRAGFAALPDDARFYTTRAAADDLDAVRAGLGYPAIDVYGASYGATVAQYYARQHADRLRSLVLDGGTLLDVPVLELIANNVERALDMLFKRCDADRACTIAYPSLRDEFATVMQRLSVAPVKSSVPDPFGRQFVIGPKEFAAALHMALVTHVTAAQVPYRIHIAYLERWDELARAAAAEGAGVASLDELAMSLVIRCNEPWARYDPAEISRVSGSAFDAPTQIMWAEDQAAACRGVARAPIGADEGTAVTSSVPALLLVGEADPQDPVGNLADARTELPASMSVVVPGHGHTVAHIGCVGTIASAFVAAGTAAGLDASCLARGGAPLAPFRIP